MFYSALLLAASALSSTAFAQYNYSQYTVDPNTVEISTRYSWCQAEHNSCPLLCGSGGFTNNTCDATTLDWSCLCVNGPQPNISDYAQTLPSLECEAWVAQCIQQHPDDSIAQSKCHSVVCGSKNVSSAAVASSSAASSAVASSTASGSASSTGSAASETTSPSAANAIAFGKSYGTGVLAAGMLALFGLAI